MQIISRGPNVSHNIESFFKINSNIPKENGIDKTSFKEPRDDS
jgi:hypothetical protein